MSPTLHEEFVTVEIDGVRIHGMLHLPEALVEQVPAVLCLHGFTASSTSDNRILVRQARRLSASGIAALRFDFRGSGQSEGEFSEMTLSGEIQDALLMLDVLSQRPEVDASRIGILGLSMGGAVAGSVLGRTDTVRAAALWAPVANPYDLLMRFAAAANVQPDPTTGLADAGGEAVGPTFLMELPLIQPVDGVRGSTVPLLVVHGTEDTTVPVADGRAYYDAATGPRHFTLVEGANHTFDALPWREKLYAETTNWFLRYL